MPYYNDKAYLAEAIESVLNQSYQNFELILINHASTDGSRDLARFYQDQRIVHVDLASNYGAGGGHIMQKFLEVATGEYFKTFCADDVMTRDCLKILISFANGYDLVFGNMNFCDENSKFLFKNWWEEKKVPLYAGECGYLPQEVGLREFFEGKSILPYPAALGDMKILRSIEINPVMHTMFDMTLWVQALIEGYKVKLIAEPVCNYRIHSEQASSSANFEKIIKSSNFENVLYCDYFSKITSVGLIKILLEKKSVFAEYLRDNEVDLIPFVIAHYYSNQNYNPHKLYGLQKITEIFKDEVLRQRIENRFGYSIKDLRAAYGEANLFNDLGFVKTSKLISVVRKRLKNKIKSLFDGKKLSVM